MWHYPDPFFSKILTTGCQIGKITPETHGLTYEQCSNKSCWRLELTLTKNIPSWSSIGEVWTKNIQQNKIKNNKNNVFIVVVVSIIINF